MAKRKRALHGEGKVNRTTEYNSWRAMRKRCLNPKDKDYPQYGGRGIKICRRWDSYIAFLKDMGRKPGLGYSIEREDVNGDYTPRNCRWATNLEQQRNRRVTMYVEYEGEKIAVSKLGERAVVGVDLFRSRIQQGWDIARALTTPRVEGWTRVATGTKFQNRKGAHRITFGNETLTLQEWCDRYGLKKRTLHWRIAQGWPMERALGLQP